MRNVKCAGDGDMAVIRVSGTKIHRTLNGEPCGWKGERYGYFNGRTWEHVNLTKPCPRCGGRVALIPST